MLGSRLAIIALVVFCLISTAYGQLGPKDGVNLKPTDLERIKVGDKAPDFTLEDMQGKKVSLSDIAGKKKMLLVFYRGHW
jgi:cytochrome oxidase Cu insertion factor (SCO1/SenC/PrrC family)